MKTIARRLRRLEDQFGPEDGKPRVLLVMHKAGWGLALDRDTCIHVLDECGFLPERGWSVLYLGSHPRWAESGGTGAVPARTWCRIVWRPGHRSASGDPVRSVVSRLTRLERLNRLSTAPQRLRIQYGNLTTLPDDYIGPRHTVTVQQLATDAVGHEWFEWEERPGV
jgi:hypothetical protein